MMGLDNRGGVMLWILNVSGVFTERFNRCLTIDRSMRCSNRRSCQHQISRSVKKRELRFPLTLTWDQASFFLLLFFFFFASLAREGKKNNAWYIYLTSSQPPPNLHNLTFAWPVMFLANKRLPNGNQILARIMSLLKSVLGKKIFKYVRVQMALRKKKKMCCFCDEIYC